MIHLGPRACRELLGEQRVFLSNRDGGWDLDLVVGNSIQQLSFFERLASGSPEQRTGASNPFNGIDVGSYAAPAVADWDGDGDVNLVAWLYSSSNAGGNLIALLRDAGGNLIAHPLRGNPALSPASPAGVALLVRAGLGSVRRR